MNSWIYSCSLVLSTVILAVSGQTCPPDYFTATLSINIEFRTQLTMPPFVPDPELTFFRNDLKFRENEIQHTIDDAIQFFNSSFGLDFSESVQNEQYERVLGNAKMGPVRTTPEAYSGSYVNVNTWLRSGSTRTNCYLVRNGVFGVVFSDTTLLHGSYGGDAGKPVGVTDNIVYGYHLIDGCQQSPLVIQRQSATPLRFEPVDGISVFTHDLYSRVLGYGKAHGIITFRPDPDDPNYVRYTARDVLTFPAL